MFLCCIASNTVHNINLVLSTTRGENHRRYFGSQKKVCCYNCPEYPRVSIVVAIRSHLVVVIPGQEASV